MILKALIYLDFGNYLNKIFAKFVWKPPNPWFQQFSEYNIACIVILKYMFYTICDSVLCETDSNTQEKSFKLKCVFPQFCSERKKNYCLFVKIQGHCPKLFFINEFLFLINCSQIHISASFRSLAFHHVPVLSLEMFSLSHCHMSALQQQPPAVPEVSPCGCGLGSLRALSHSHLPLQEMSGMRISWHGQQRPSPNEVYQPILLAPSFQASRCRQSYLRYTFCSPRGSDSDKIKYLFNLFLHGADSDGN